MAWTTPRTWSAGEVVTAAHLNEQVRDNVAFLGDHHHTGAAGDGAALDLIPRFTSGSRVGFWVPINGAVTSSHLASADTANGAIQAAAYDATSNTIYNALRAATAGGHAVLSSVACCTVELLPVFNIQARHIAVVTSTVTLGLTTAFTTGNPTDGVFFRSTDGGNWIAVTRNGGTETTTDTGVAASSSTARELRIVVESTANVKFYIDGALEATHTTNIPSATTVLAARAGMTSSAGSNLDHAVGQGMGFSYLAVG